MGHGHKILVVAQSSSLAGTLLTWLSDRNHDLVLVNSFAAAKVHLRTSPHVLITEIKLGAYNGLHLVMLGKASGVRAIVLGDSDAVFEQLAAQLGAAYLPAAGLEADDLRAMVDRVAHSGPIHDGDSFAWSGSVGTFVTPGTSPDNLLDLDFADGSGQIH